MSFEIESFIKKAYFRLDVWATVLPFYWYLICVIWYMLFFIKIDFFTKKVTPQIWFFDYLIHVIFHLERFFFSEKVTPQIWFLDRSFQWHFLAATFTQYFRMLIIHMGIVGWQYYFTDVGLTPEVKVLFIYNLIMLWTWLMLLWYVATFQILSQNSLRIQIT